MTGLTGDISANLNLVSNSEQKLSLFNIFKGRRGFEKLYYCFHRQTAGHITASKAWADGAADKGRLFKIDTH